MRILIVALSFVATISGLFLFENFKTPPQETNYAKIIGEIQGSTVPTATPQSTKVPIKTYRPTKQPATTLTATTTPSSTPSTTSTPINHIYYTSSATQAKYYYCDTDSDWKNLSKTNLKQFLSPEELLKSYPNRVLHEPCK